MQVLIVASFASAMVDLAGRWAILPTWLFFVVLGNTSSGGAVSTPLLPEPFAFVSEWLPTGASVSALRNAVYSVVPARPADRGPGDLGRGIVCRDAPRLTPAPDESRHRLSAGAQRRRTR